MNPEKLTLRRILSVACPRCGARPKHKCTLSTGQPSAKTHIDRELAAGKISRPESSAQSFLRMLKSFTRTRLSFLFQHK